MNHLIPDVPVSITILVVSVAVVFTVWVPVIMYRAGIRHGRSTCEAGRLAGALIVVFAVWFGLSAGYTQVEALHDGPDRTPWLVYVFFALIVVGPIAVARWSSLDELLADRRTLAELLISQTARWLGCVFGVLGSLAEYERELIKERTALKRASSRASGTKFGRPRKVDDSEHITTAKRMKADGHTGKDIAKYLGVSRATLYRYLSDATVA